MSKKKEDECCGNCRFFFEDGKQCRRFPPQVGTETSEHSCGVFATFPIVYKQEWCGEFKIKG